MSPSVQAMSSIYNPNPMLKNLLIPSLLISSILVSCSGDSTKKTESESVVKVEVEAATAPASGYAGPAGVPSFMMIDMEGKPVNSADFKGNLTIFLFNPDCDHCQREAKVINAAKNLFREKQIWFVSMDEPQVIAKFRTDYGLTDNNFHFAKSDVELVVRALGPVSSVPALFIYKEGKLSERLEGEHSAEELASKM